MTRPRVLEFSVALDGTGRFDRADGNALVPDPSWTPEDLVLAGLAQCSLKSLAYHARAAGSEAHASASVSGTVTRRDEDGRYAFVSVEVRIDVRLEPALEGEALAELLSRAERDCFVGASLTAKPVYDWHVEL